jgi:hypothetical protein
MPGGLTRESLFPKFKSDVATNPKSQATLVIHPRYPTSTVNLNSKDKTHVGGKALGSLKVRNSVGLRSRPLDSSSFFFA